MNITLYRINKDGEFCTICFGRDTAERVAESYRSSFPLSKIEIVEDNIEKSTDEYVAKLGSN